MANYTVTIYKSAGDLAAAIEAIDNTTTIQVVPFIQAGKQKYMLIQ